MMKSLFAQILLVGLACLCATTAFAQSTSEKPTAKIGQITIVGNDVTQESVIHRAIRLYPGMTLSYPKLRNAERRLAKLDLFAVDPELGIRSTVTVVDPCDDKEVKDILVQVKEMPTGSMMFQPGLDCKGNVVMSFVLEERNLDLCGLPTSLDDLCEGRAFRGAGQYFRLELFQVGVSAPFIRVLPDEKSTLVQLRHLLYDAIELFRSEN